MGYAHKEYAAMDKNDVKSCLADLELNPNYKPGGPQSAVGKGSNKPAASGSVGPFKKK